MLSRLPALVSLVGAFALGGCFLFEGPPTDTPDAGAQEAEFQHGEGALCDPNGDENVCSDLELVCSRFLLGAHEHWACARTGATRVPIAARTKAIYRPPGEGAQEETRLEIKLDGSDQELSGTEITVVRAPKGQIEMRGDAIFYRPHTEPDSVTSPFEEGPTAGKVAYYDHFSFKMGNSQEIVGLIDLRAPVERGGHSGTLGHKWEVEVDTGRMGWTGAVHESFNAKLTANRAWAECWVMKEISYPMACLGGAIAIGVGLSIGLEFETDHPELLLLKTSGESPQACDNSDFPMFSIKQTGVGILIADFGYCWAHVITESNHSFGGRGFCGGLGGLGFKIGGAGITCLPVISPSGNCYEITPLSPQYGYACGPPDHQACSCRNDCGCGAYGSDIFCDLVNGDRGMCSPCEGEGCNRCDQNNIGEDGDECQDDGDCPEGQWCNNCLCQAEPNGMCQDDADCVEPGMPCCMAGACGPMPDGMQSCQ